MAQIDIRTTPVNFQTYKSITDGNGLFKTWTDIINMDRDFLPINEEILGQKIKNPIQVIGDNIVFKNLENKNITYFDQDLTKRNNVITENKMVMLLYTDYMLPLEVDYRDSRSVIEWSEMLSQAMTSLLQAKQDMINMETIDQINKVNIALGQVLVLPGCNEQSFDYNANKALGQIIVTERFKMRRIRTKYMKGYSKALESCMIDPFLSLNLLTGLTSGSNASSESAFKETEDRFTINRIFDHDFETSNMYLGLDIGMSEFTPDSGGSVSDLQNKGINTGILTRPYFFKDLAGLIFYRESVASYGHEYSERDLPVANTRTKEVFTKYFRFNVAVKPIYAKMNKSIFSKIPSFPSYVDLKGNTIPKLDMNVKADYERLVNDLYNSQPDLYKMFGWNGSFTIDQSNLSKLWSDNTIEWKEKAMKLYKKKK